jgi:hypothetical protein
VPLCERRINGNETGCGGVHDKAGETAPFDEGRAVFVGEEDVSWSGRNRKRGDHRSEERSGALDDERSGYHDGGARNHLEGEGKQEGIEHWELRHGKVYINKPFDDTTSLGGAALSSSPVDIEVSEQIDAESATGTHAFCTSATLKQPTGFVVRAAESLLHYLEWHPAPRRRSPQGSGRSRSVTVNETLP